jgi:hypothetical protein
MAAKDSQYDRCKTEGAIFIDAMYKFMQTLKDFGGVSQAAENVATSGTAQEDPAKTFHLQNREDLMQSLMQALTQSKMGDAKQLAAELKLASLSVAGPQSGEMQKAINKIEEKISDYEPEEALRLLSEMEVKNG